MDVVVAISVLVCAGVLVVSLVSTWRDGGLAGLVSAVSDLGSVPPSAARVVAPLVVAAEGALVLGLLLPVRATVPLTATALLFSGYAVALTIAVRRGADTACHCFGASRERVAPRHVVRTSCLAALAVAGAVTGAATGAGAWTSLTPGEWALTIATALVAVGFVVRLDDVAWLFARRGVA